MSTRPHARLLRLACAAGSARLAYRALTSRAGKSWIRTNHAGEPVTLLEGPAAAAGAAWSVLTVPGLAARERIALTAAGLGAAAVGCYDDLAGSGDKRGFRGHLGALAQGEVTTGAVKLLGIGAAGLAAAIALGADRPGWRRPVDVVINTGLVAGSANLLNLFDLRPGRAIKVLLLASGALAAAGAGDAIAAPAGAAIALLPEDLGERAMLGDAGANALGAMAGVAAASALSRRARLAVLTGVAGLTVMSEKVSFTKVIARTPALDWLDQLGRRPPGPAGKQSPARAGTVRPEGGPPLRETAVPQPAP
ncbi:MAG TPA: hypothetical protein VFQ44_12445 [Streptosporangiaceae bacterium]|nr:hypothetical protein [Streptosporangiaceae bacterium]